MAKGQSYRMSDISAGRGAKINMLEGMLLKDLCCLCSFSFFKITLLISTLTPYVPRMHHILNIMP